MLKRVLESIEGTRGPVHVAELSRRLGIERSALEGMITYWVQKGRLIDDDGMACSPGASRCSTSCTGASNCAFLAKMPKTFSVDSRQ